MKLMTSTTKGLFVWTLVCLVVCGICDDTKEDCRRGSEYICKSLERAVRCEFVDFCVNFDWAHRNDEEDGQRSVNSGSNEECEKCLKSGIPTWENVSRMTECVVRGKCSYDEPACASITEYAECGDQWSTMYLDPNLMGNDVDGCQQCQRIVSLMDNDKNVIEMINSTCGGRRECSDPLFKHFTEIIGLKKRKTSSIRPSVLCALIGRCGKHSLSLMDSDKRNRDSVLCVALWKRLSNMIREGSVSHSVLIDECSRIESYTRAECVEAVHHSLALMEKNINLGLLTPQSTCEQLGMVVRSDVVHPLVDQISATSEVACEACIIVVSTAKEMINEDGPDTVKKIQKYLDEHICRRIPLITEKCRNFVYNETNLLLDYLKSLEPVDTCRALHVCSTPSTDGSNSNFICTKCSDFVFGIRMSTICRVKRIFNFIIIRICELVPHAAQDQCSIAVGELKDRIVEIVQKVFDPDMMCKPFCGLDIREKAVLNMEALLNARTDLDKFEKIIGLIALQLNATQPAESKRCRACMAFSWDKMGSQGIFTEAFCEPNDVACRMFINDFAGPIKSLLESEGNPTKREACETLGLCGGGDGLDRCHTSDFPDYASYDPCASCLHLDSRDLKALTSSISTKDRMERGLKLLCTDSKCDRFMVDHGPSLAALLIRNEIDHSGICRKGLNLCPSHKTDHCLVCHLMSRQLDHLINQNPPITEESLKLILPKACKALEQRLQPACSDLLFHYEPTIISAITGSLQLPAKNICPKLGICGTNLNSQESVSSVMCPVCVALVESIQRALLKNSTRTQMLDASIKLCRALSPSTYEPACEKFVESHIDQMIGLAESTSANAACHLMAMCRAPDFDDAIVSLKQWGAVDMSYCSMCQLVVMTTRAFTEQSHLIDKVTGALKNAICTRIHEVDSNRDCTELMDSVSRVLNLIVDKTDSLTICTSIFDACPITPPPEPTKTFNNYNNEDDDDDDDVWRKHLV